MAGKGKGIWLVELLDPLPEEMEGQVGKIHPRMDTGDDVEGQTAKGHPRFDPIGEDVEGHIKMKGSGVYQTEEDTEGHCGKVHPRLDSIDDDTAGNLMVVEFGGPEDLDLTDQMVSLRATPDGTSARAHVLRPIEDDVEGQGYRGGSTGGLAETEDDVEGEGFRGGTKGGLAETEDDVEGQGFKKFGP